MGWWLHTTLQFSALPVSESMVQELASSQVTGQLPSQVSRSSTTPSPQVPEQSWSVWVVQPAGQ